MTDMRTPDAPAPQPGGPASPVTIDVIETPHSVAVSNDGSRVYVSHFLSGSITLIDTSTESVAAVLESSPGAYGVAPTFNDKFLHVAHPDSDFLQTVQVKSGNKVSDGIGAKAYGLAAVKGGRLYATAALDDAILVLDVALVDTLDNLVRNVARIDGVKFPSQSPRRRTDRVAVRQQLLLRHRLDHRRDAGFYRRVRPASRCRAKHPGGQSGRTGSGSVPTVPGCS